MIYFRIYFIQFFYFLLFIIYNINSLQSLSNNYISHNVIKYTADEVYDPSTNNTIYESALLYYKFNGNVINDGTIGTSENFISEAPTLTYQKKLEPKGLYLRYGTSNAAYTNYLPKLSTEMPNCTFSVWYYPYDTPGDTVTNNVQGRRAPIHCKTDSQQGNSHRFGMLYIQGTTGTLPMPYIFVSGSISFPSFTLEYNKWTNILITYERVGTTNSIIGTIYIRSENNDITFTTTRADTYPALSTVSQNNTGIMLGRENYRDSPAITPGYYTKLAFWDRLLTSTEIDSIRNEFI